MLLLLALTEQVIIKPPILELHSYVRNFYWEGGSKLGNLLDVPLQASLENSIFVSLALNGLGAALVNLE